MRVSALHSGRFTPCKNPSRKLDGTHSQSERLEAKEKNLASFGILTPVRPASNFATTCLK